MKNFLRFVFLAALFMSLGWILSAAYASIELIPEPGRISIQPVDREGPSDRISPEKVRVYSDRVVMDIANVRWSSLADTNSMAPILDSQTHTLEVLPLSSSEISVGDIISFQRGNDIIIHRVQFIDIDQLGWYAYTKGDNAPFRDRPKVRFHDVTGIVVGILY